MRHMISPKTEELLRRLLNEQPSYRPTETVLRKLRQIDFTCFVGATCMGKTTLMDALVQHDPQRYGKTRNFVTRPPRPDDDPNRYYYFEHTDEGLRPIFERIATHELLQYNINPFTLHIYGSEVDGYPHTYNLGDIFASSIDGFRQLDFGTLRVCSVLTEPEIWRTRFEARFPTGHPQRQARLQEAAASLAWSLEQATPDHCWIFDAEGEIEKATATADALISHSRAPDAGEALRHATACLATIQELCRA